MEEDEESGGRGVKGLDAEWSGSTVGCIGVIPDESTVKTNSQFPWPLLKLRLQWSPVSLFRQCGRGLFYMTYSEKLKDPRWQKKRLKILERDKWACRDCGCAEKSLQVHHCYYEKGDPWKTNERFLLTLCEECHVARGDLEEDARRAIGMIMADTRYWEDDPTLYYFVMSITQLAGNPASCPRMFDLYEIKKRLGIEEEEEA